MALTFLQYWQQQMLIYQAEQAVARTDLVAARARFAVAGKALNGDPAQPPGPLCDGDQKTLAKIGAAIAAKRAALADETSPPDAAALVDEITALIIKQRAQQGVVLDDLDELASAQAASDVATAALVRADARVAAVQSAIVPATAADDRRAALRTAIAAAPLSTLQADATTLLGGATVTHATSRIGKNFPAALVAIADKRHATRVGRLASLRTSVAAAEDALGAETAGDSGLGGKAEQKRIAFERAQQAVADYVASAAARLAQAGAVLRRLETIEVAAPGTVPDVLTDPEKARLLALAAAGAAAEPTAASLDTDVNAVIAAQAALDAQVLTAIAADPDSAATDPTVASKRAAIGTALSTFASARAAFAAANKADLDLWQAAIPDTAWKVLLDYEEGLDSLTVLSATNPAVLVAAMDTAEHDYAAALLAAAVAERKAASLADAVALRQKALDAAQAVIGARLPSAIRGDSY